MLSPSGLLLFHKVHEAVFDQPRMHGNETCSRFAFWVPTLASGDVQAERAVLSNDIDARTQTYIRLDGYSKPSPERCDVLLTETGQSGRGACGAPGTATTPSSRLCRAGRASDGRRATDERANSDRSAQPKPHGIVTLSALRRLRTLKWWGRIVNRLLIWPL